MTHQSNKQFNTLQGGIGFEGPTAALHGVWEGEDIPIR